MWSDALPRPDARNPGGITRPCRHAARGQEPSHCHIATAATVALSHCDGQDRPGGPGRTRGGGWGWVPGRSGPGGDGARAALAVQDDVDPLVEEGDQVADLE